MLARLAHMLVVTVRIVSASPRVVGIAVELRHGGMRFVGNTNHIPDGSAHMGGSAVRIGGSPVRMPDYGRNVGDKAVRLPHRHC